jgi:AICAR transformylase/IMP cyclohydrolase PurH
MAKMRRMYGCAAQAGGVGTASYSAVEINQDMHIKFILESREREGSECAKLRFAITLAFGTRSRNIVCAKHGRFVGIGGASG